MKRTVVDEYGLPNGHRARCTKKIEITKQDDELGPFGLLFGGFIWFLIISALLGGCSQ